MPSRRASQAPLSEFSAALALVSLTRRGPLTAPSARGAGGIIVRRLRRIFLYGWWALGTSELVHEIGQADEILGAEATPTCRGRSEAVDRRRVRPPEGYVVQPLRLVPEVDPVFPPGLLLRHQLELAAEERVKRMSHPDARP